MITIKDQGKFETVPQIVTDLIGGNIGALAAYFTLENINCKIEINKYIALMPLELALMMECLASVEWLVEHGADLNRADSPSFLTAVRYCDETMIRYVVRQGANVAMRDRLGSDAYVQALYGKKHANLPLIDELGHSARQQGGRAFRQAVADRDYRAVEFFLGHGADINYNAPDQVYPFKPTPLCVAVRYTDFKMVRYLVECGADVTCCEKDGMRPYSIAMEAGNMEVAAYLKALEPPQFHSLQNKLAELRPYKLTTALVNFLQSDNLHIELPNCDFACIDFFSLMDTVPMTAGRKKLLRISRTTGDYEHIVFGWNPKTRKLAYYDVEHDELADMCSFDEFLKAPSVYMQKVLDGEYGE